MTTPNPTAQPYPPVLAAKIRRMDPWLLANILTKKEDKT